MANAKEISNRIKSIQDTMKITRAMYMISSIKLRKARKKLEDTEPYFYGLQNQISSILYHFPDIQDQYFDNHFNDRNKTVTKKGFIVITGDKGMAGAYNHNVIKEAQGLVKDAEDYQLFVVGELGRQNLSSQNYHVAGDFAYTATNPSVHRARMISERIVELYKSKELDEVYVIYTRMVNSMKAEVEVQQLLPLKSREFIKQEMLEKAQNADKNSHLHKYVDYEEFEKGNEYATDFTIFPSPQHVLENVVNNYVTGFIYGAMVEASASEENARMMAMQSATDNAQDMLKELSVEYNRVRQAAITQEITEVIGGAKSLKRKK